MGLVYPDIFLSRVLTCLCLGHNSSQRYPRRPYILKPSSFIIRCLALARRISGSLSLCLPCFIPTRPHLPLPLHEHISLRTPTKPTAIQLPFLPDPSSSLSLSSLAELLVSPPSSDLSNGTVYRLQGLHRGLNRRGISQAFLEGSGWRNQYAKCVREFLV